MNNDQFRRLLATPGLKTGPNTSTPRRDGSASAALGSRMRSSIPMTPRSVIGSSGIDFARQLAERNAQSQPAKRFKSSAAPKGAKLPSGYRDRTQDRTSTEDDDKAARVKALEEMVKLGQMDWTTFQKLRDEIVGGDIGTTHLVKGLDYKLLERVRRGEDVLNAGAKQEESRKEPVREDDVEAELEKLEAKEVAPLVKEKIIKKGEMAPPPLSMSTSVAGKKRSRDEILAQLRASRKAAAQKTSIAPILGPKFRKLGEKKEQPRIERDDKGRELLITVDEEGRVKRKVKKVKVGEDAPSISTAGGLPMPDKDAKPLGMEVPEALSGKQPIEEEDDGDIFEDAGSDYDPLGDVGEEDDEDDELSDDEERRTSKTDPVRKQEEGARELDRNSPSSSSPASIPDESTAQPRNYFATSSVDQATTDNHTNNSLTNDPTILAALRKASKINPSIINRENPDANDDEEQARIARRQKLLSASDRDAEDLDLGFGSSRFEDEEDMEERKVKLSVWGGGDEAAGGGGGDGAGKKRKRGPKKKKGGDVNNAADLLKVLERRKGSGGG